MSICPLFQMTLFVKLPSNQSPLTSRRLIYLVLCEISMSSMNHTTPTKNCPLGCNPRMVIHVHLLITYCHDVLNPLSVPFHNSLPLNVPHLFLTHDSPTNFQPTLDLHEFSQFNFSFWSSIDNVSQKWGCPVGWIPIDMSHVLFTLLGTFYITNTFILSVVS